jgi:hypothetical protein
MSRVTSTSAVAACRARRTASSSQVCGEEGVPQHVHAVEVQDGVAGFDPVDRDLGGRDAAQCGRGHGHLGGQGLRRQQLPELSPLLVDIAYCGKG